jgi:N-acetyl-anhydromuramyl-L-alanine amidase AmpD
VTAAVGGGASNPIVAADALPPIPMVEAKFYRRGLRQHPAIWLVVHATAGAEGAGKAMNGARELHTLPDNAPKKRSAHLIIDTSAIVQCVPFASEAWHAGHHANLYAEGIELCGSADQTREQWLDAKSLPMLQLAARVLRWRSTVTGIPLTQLMAADLVAMRSGVTTHAEITKAFPKDTDHYDPGPHFPMAELLAAAVDAT